MTLKMIFWCIVLDLGHFVLDIGFIHAIPLLWYVFVILVSQLYSILCFFSSRQKYIHVDTKFILTLISVYNSRAKYGLENEVSKLETELSELKRAYARLEGDHTRLTEQHRHLQVH